MSELDMIYNDRIKISAITNRPVESNHQDTYKDIPAFLCTVCDIKMKTATLTLQHFFGKVHQGKLGKSSLPTTAYKGNKDNFTSSSRKRGIDSIGQHNRPIEPIRKISKPSSNVMKSSEASSWSCELCDNTFNSQRSAEQHYKGKKHLQAIAEQAQKDGSFPKIPVSAVTTNVKGDPLAKYHCTFCDIGLNSDEQMTQHCSGVRHKLKAGQIKEPPAWWSEQQEGFQQTQSTRTSGKGMGEQYECQICHIFLNSDSQLAQHLTSIRHKDNESKQHKPARGGGRGASRGGGRGGNQNSSNYRGNNRGGGNSYGGVSRGGGNRGSSSSRGRGNQTTRGGNTRGRGGSRGASRGGSQQYGSRGKDNTYRGSNRGGGNYKNNYSQQSAYTTTGGQCGAPEPDAASPNFMPMDFSRIKELASKPKMLPQKSFTGANSAIDYQSFNQQQLTSQPSYQATYQSYSVPATSTPMQSQQYATDFSYDQFYQ